MSATESSPLSSSLTQYTITVLLVDDQAIVAASVERMLAGEKDIVFHYCKDPTQAIRQAVEISPTVILQDLVMPEIDGLTLVKFFRAHPKLKDVPLIVLSSKEEAVTKAEAFAVGANDYLVKLPDKVELIARIRYHSKGYINLLQRNEAYEALLKSQQALASELAKAAEHVISILPAPISEGSIRTEWRLFPSAQLGGDAFGYHWIDEDNFSIYLLDVCDHGVGSALLAVSALNVLRSQALPNTDFTKPDQVLAGLNGTFQMPDHNDMFFTIWYGVYNKKTGELRFASAGHPPAMLISSSGSVEKMMTNNFIVGGLPDTAYSCNGVTVRKPATMYVFSDGVYEIHKKDGAMWSMEEMYRYLQNPGVEPEQEIDTLYRLCQEMSGSTVLDDDFSMLKVMFT
jgi:phosphoserine phosphatase RsbU/P